MKGVRFVFALVFVPVLCFSQSHTESVVISSGSTIVTQEGSMDWVVGESLIGHHVLFGESVQGDAQIEQRSNSFLAYPTVTSDRIHIITEMSDPVSLSVYVHNMADKIVVHQKWTRNPMDVDLSKLANGVYIIRLANQEKLVFATFKVIKK